MVRMRRGNTLSRHVAKKGIVTMRKRFSLAVALVCVLGTMVFVLAGCGGNNSSGSTEESSGGAATSATSTTTSASGSYTLVKDGVLTCISETGFAPFEYIDVTSDSTDPIGYDIDVANEVAKRLGLTCEFLPSQDFDTLLPTIAQGGKADIAIAGITIQPDRAAIVDFSDPYYSSNLAVIVKKGSTETLKSLDATGKQIACQTGTTGNDWIKENLPQVDQPVALSEVSAGLNGVVSGMYDAYVIDLPVAEKTLGSYADLVIMEKIATGEEYGIAISKDNPALTKAVNGILSEMRDDGTLAQLETKWLSDPAAASSEE